MTVYLLEGDSAALDLGEDGLGGGGPDEGLGVLVVHAQVDLDRGDEVGDARECAAPEVLVGELAEEAFDEVEPA